jgi:hypothetical protein
MSNTNGTEHCVRCKQKPALLRDLCEACFTLTLVKPLVEQHDRAIDIARICDDSLAELYNELENARAIAYQACSFWRPGLVRERRDFFDGVKNVPIQVIRDISDFEYHRREAVIEANRRARQQAQQQSKSSKQAKSKPTKQAKPKLVMGDNLDNLE